MSKDIELYAGALRFAFAQSFGGDPKDWKVGEERTNAAGTLVQEFRNAVTGVTLDVSGAEKDDYGQFNAKRTDKGPQVQDELNCSIPKAWTKLDLG